jgi:hypothetical protein
MGIGANRNQKHRCRPDVRAALLHHAESDLNVTSVIRRYHNYALFVRPTAGSTRDIGVFHQLSSGVPVNPFAKSELLY